MASSVFSSNSAAGILALLEDEDSDIQEYALGQLDAHVSQFWPEISDSLIKIETIYENATSSQKQVQQLAALVISKVYFHLGDLEESLNFALNAGDLFKIDEVDSDMYTETVISQCVDKYIALSSGTETPLASTSKSTADQSRLQVIVEKMLQRCIRDQEYKQALGIALETRRLDVLQNILSSKEALQSDPTLLSYVLQSTMTTLTRLDLRNRVLNLLVTLFYQSSTPDYFSITQCFIYLNDPSQAVTLLQDLLKQSESDQDKLLIAQQVAFDLADNATQEFLETVRKGLQGEGDAAMTNGDAANATPVDLICKILTGKEAIRLYLEFLYKNNHADLLILKKTKDSLEGRNSVFHSAVTFANAFLNAGTTSDLFLRDNLDWLAKASNWSKFSATAALGVIHKGNLDQAMEILQPYLPPTDGSSSTSVYSEGGSLYALGLINANHGSGVLAYLQNALKTNQSEVILHGAALGLGVAGMASANEEIYDELRNVLFNDSAVAGEAAGYAMGLVMLGTASTKALDEMLQYAHETQHEKIIRGLAIGISFLMYGKQEEADSLIETLGADKDPILRYGGIYTIALAYAGTGNNKAIRKLLHVAVSDVNDDVRRAAVIALGFILFRNPTQVPRIVQLLSESYNPNVRYGATLALGISCAGTGLEEAVELLEPMTKDPVDFVRQGACVSLGMILIQQNETLNPKAGSVRKIFENIIKDKHEDAMAKLGATMAQGIIDAGGRNVTISMQSKSGSANMPAIVGLALFTQFWYWFPLAHAATLAFTPTAIIGVDQDLKLPKFEFTSGVKPSLFAYQPQTKPPQKEEIEKVASAVLSTTAKTTARAKKREEEKGDSMDTDEKPSTSENKREGDAMDTDAPAKTNDEAAGPATKKRRKDEPSSEQLPNLSRVVPAQLPYISFSSESRFQPVRPILSVSPAKSGVQVQSKGKKATQSPAAAAILQQSSAVSTRAGGGIFVMRDTKKGEAIEFMELEAVKALEQSAPAPAPSSGSSNSGPLAIDTTAPSADPPAPFEYPFGQD